MAHVGNVGAHEVRLERLELELGVGAEAVDVGHVLGQAAVVLVRRLGRGKVRVEVVGRVRVGVVGRVRVPAPSTAPSPLPSPSA